MKKLTPAQKRMEMKFHDLVIKKCMGNLTAQERIRLERHQVLRRSYLGFTDPAILSFEVRRDWGDRKALKLFRRALYEAGLPRL